VIEFAFPWAALFLLLPPLVYLLPPYRQRQASVQVPYFDRLVRLSGETPTRGASAMRRMRIQGAVSALGWLLMCTALARPEWVGPPVQVEKSARDLMVALDLSGSMDTADFDGAEGGRQRRLDAAKEVLRAFAGRRDGDRLGLIVFGNAAYLQAPFTDDLDTWVTLLAESEVAMAGPSTALGDAIGLAIALFKASETENRVLVILTDGNDTGSRVPPRDAAEVARAEGVTIYAVAVGDPETVGEEALDMDTLEAIAARTGGAAFQAMDREALEGAYKRIDALEPARFDTLSYRPRRSLFHYPLGAMALLYAVALPSYALLARRRRRVLAS
jgi:Ca-activated chloride channel family protein